MKYDGDGRASARFFSDKGCRRAPLFTAPADAARQKRCLWSVSRVRRARDGRFYRSRLASVTVYASPSPFSDERPSSRFRGITLPSKRDCAGPVCRQRLNLRGCPSVRTPVYRYRAA
ncbi:TPA: hypothetical protein ACH999_004523 [Escherichia coli]